MKTLSSENPSRPSPRSAAIRETPPNRTGLPDALKQGVESLSNMSLDHVRVHRNSSQPAQLGALAYAQGHEIHLGPGQEKHLPHEAWHVVQQAQGRVRPTGQINGVSLNDDAALEREADVMGQRAGQSPASSPHETAAASRPAHLPVVSRKAATSIVQMREKGEAITAETEIKIGQHTTDHGHTLEEIRAAIVAGWERRRHRSGDQYSVRWGEGAPEGVIFYDNGDGLTVTHAQSSANITASRAKTAKDAAEKKASGGGSESSSWRAREAPNSEAKKSETNTGPSGSVTSLQRIASAPSPLLRRAAPSVVQCVIYPNMAAMWAAVHPGYALANIAQDSALSALYDDAAAELPHTDFVQAPGIAPQITSTPLAPQPFRVDWDTAANLGLNAHYFAGAVLHELAHAASSQQYTRHGANANGLIWANMNLPAPSGPVNPANGLAQNQLQALQRQITTVDNNWNDLEAIAQNDLNRGNLPPALHAHVYGRIQYARATTFVHNDTVLGDVVYYLLAHNLANLDTYAFARRMLKEANDRRRNGLWSNPGTEVRRVDSRAWWFQFWKW